jgi:hypothetical protein
MVPQVQFKQFPYIIGHINTFWKESLLKRVFISTKLAENKPCIKHNQIKNG